MQHVLNDIEICGHFFSYRFPIWLRRLYNDYWRDDAFQHPSDSYGFYMHVDIPSDIASDEKQLVRYNKHLRDSTYKALRLRYSLDIDESIAETYSYPDIVYFFNQLTDDAAMIDDLLEQARYWLIWLVHIHTSKCDLDADELFSQPGSLTEVEPPQDSKSHT